jgi:hypothetical protein
VNEAAFGEEFFGSGTCKKMTKQADKSNKKQPKCDIWFRWEFL